jgi:hypothetical protein
MMCRLTASSPGKDLVTTEAGAKPSAAHCSGDQCGVSKNARPTTWLRAAVVMVYVNREGYNCDLRWAALIIDRCRGFKDVVDDVKCFASLLTFESSG